jgi:anthranilate phosphoribosyltransferase
MDTQGIPTIDVCGTGGDGKDTFNISTLAAFVCAGAGVYVAKHGNYAVSSACGSSDVLEYLGIRLSQNPDILLRQLDQANICILHAPLFHPAMKHVAPIRKAMGVKTLFNLLGPICNPAHNEFQCTGTFKPEVAYLYHQLFMEKKEGYTVFYDMAGYDEISLQGNIILYSNGKQKTWLHLDFPFTVADAHDIAGGNSIADHAAIFMQVLNNQCTEAQRNVVVVNAAVAIHTYFPNLSFDDAMTMAMQSLISGKAKESFMKMKNLQQ